MRRKFSPCWNETFRSEQVFAPLTLIDLVLDTDKHLNLNKYRGVSAHIQTLVPPTLFINSWLHKMTALHQRWQITNSLVLHTRHNISHCLSQSVGAQSSPSLFWHHGSVQCSSGPSGPSLCWVRTHSESMSVSISPVRPDSILFQWCDVTTVTS